LRVITVNTGSSSTKCAVVDAISGRVTAERQAAVSAGVDLGPLVRGALTDLLEQAGDPAPRAVAHRIVHGGERFSRAVLVDGEVARALAGLAGRAPLHNPAALAALDAARTLLPDIAHVACFDTAFHSTLPRHARTYASAAAPGAAVPRRSGFHGLSHAAVMRRVAAETGSDARDLRIVSLHLGAGASACAIAHGASIDTSMGVTPLEGLVMATRGGDLDPGIVLEWQRCGASADAIETRLYREGGLLALTGSADMRVVEQRAAKGDEACRQALTLFGYRVRKYIGAYAAAMSGVDVIAFTGGIGANSAAVRQQCLQGLAFLGVALDEDANRDCAVDRRNPARHISGATSKVRVLVIATEEEIEMALQTQVLLGGAGEGA
jgi:acetate kinase